MTHPVTQADRDAAADDTCIVRRPIRRFGVTVGQDTVICGQRTVERYLRIGYNFDWPATDRARAIPSSSGESNG